MVEKFENTAVTVKYIMNDNYRKKSQTYIQDLCTPVTFILKRLYEKSLNVSIFLKNYLGTKLN